MSLSNNRLADATLGQRYQQALLLGDRTAARNALEDASNLGVTAITVLTDLIWPVMERMQAAYKDDLVSHAALNMATRLNRLMADQLSAKLERKAAKGKKAVIFCGDAEPEELGGQICADLFEQEGWEVRFVGGGVPNDEALSMIGEYRPDLTVMFATLASAIPSVRKLIDYLREVNSCPNMQLMCAGGIYKRAEGLSEEIGADLYAADALEAVKVASSLPARRATLDQQTVGRTRRIKKAAIRKAETDVVVEDGVEKLGERTIPTRIAPHAAGRIGFDRPADGYRKAV